MCSRKTKMEDVRKIVRFLSEEYKFDAESMRKGKKKSRKIKHISEKDKNKNRKRIGRALYVTVGQGRIELLKLPRSQSINILYTGK